MEEEVQCPICGRTMRPLLCTYCYKLFFRCGECHLFREVGVQNYIRFDFVDVESIISTTVCYTCFNELFDYIEDLKEPE